MIIYYYIKIILFNYKIFIIDNIKEKKTIPFARNLDLASILFALITGKDIKDKINSKNKSDIFWKEFQFSLN
jgi:hypothetical protein